MDSFGCGSCVSDVDIHERAAYADNPLEDLVIRQDEKGRLKARAKLVRPDLIQGISTHGSKGRLELNRVLGKDGAAESVFADLP